MFDFEKLTAYSKAKEFNRKTKHEILTSDSIDKTSKDQLQRASLRIVLNIAESTSRFSDADKKIFTLLHEEV